MIIKPIEDYKTNRAKLPEVEKILVDALIYDMLNVAEKMKQLGIDTDNHYMQMTLNSNYVLQFIVDPTNDWLIVALYNGA